MLPYQMIAGGTFATVGTPPAQVVVSCNSQNPPDFIITKSITGYGLANTAQSIEWWWEQSMAQYTAKGIQQSSDATNPALTSKSLSTLGISTYDQYNPPTFASLAATAIDKTTFVVSMSNTGTISVGDTVLLTGVVAMGQINSYIFGVTAVTVNTSITLGYMASGATAFAANASAANVTKFIPQSYYPNLMYIAGITQATQAVVSFTQPNNFTPGEFISFRVPANFGMPQMNNVVARVLVSTNTATVSSVTLDWNTSGYPAFAFPTSALSIYDSPAVAVPSSSGVVPYNGNAQIAQSPPGTNLQDAFDNKNRRLIVFGSGLFGVTSFNVPSAQTWLWQAYQYDSYNNM